MRNGSSARRWWLLLAALLGSLALVAAGCGGGDDEGAAEEETTTEAQPGGDGAGAIKLAILSDCQGAFGSFYEQDIGGAQAALAEYAGGKPTDRNKPSAGMTGIRIAGKPVNIVGYGCANDRADTAIRETKRLMEQLDADIMIGPLSGDESIAVANYAKSHPNKTFINGTAGAQDTTLKVRAPNFFRYNGDGAMWNAGTGDLAYNTLKWRRAAIIMDDYSFAWTSGGGMIADFCAAGGQITKRVFPPLNTTDYSSYVQQLPGPDEVDGYFWAVGGAGTIASLKAYEQAHGPIQGKKFIGTLFMGTPGQFETLGTRVAGAYVGAGNTAGDLKTANARRYAAILDKHYDKFPPFPGKPSTQAASVFVYNYFNAAWALIKGLEAVDGDISGGQKDLQEALQDVELDAGYGHIRLDENRNAIENEYIAQLYVDDTGKLAIKTVRTIPNVDQTFGGTFSPDTPSPGRTFPRCEKRDLPWIGKAQRVVNGVVQEGGG